jgi:hypothetical protein
LLQCPASLAVIPKLAEDLGGNYEYQVTLVSEKNYFKSELKIRHSINTEGELMGYCFITSKIESVLSIRNTYLLHNSPLNEII